MMTRRWSQRLRGRSRLARVGHACGLTLSLGATPALAQSASTAGPPPSSGASSSSSSSSGADTKALQLYEQGIKHYNVAEYEGAIAAFREAYLLTNAPELLYNIAQSYRLRGPGHCRSALQFYRNFLRVEPRTPRRARVEAAIADMETCAQSEPPTTSPDGEPASDAPPPASTAPFGPPSSSPVTELPPLTAGRSTVVPFVLGGAGLGIALAGAGALAWSRLRYDAISSEGCAPACDPSRTEAPRTAQTAGAVLLGAGAALVVTGVVVWLLHPHRTPRTLASVVDRALHTGGIVF
jgi:tetratricopeptide (TPR) repeat protein